ncbi:MAG: LytR C-terminal domain-containing protein [Gemmatimonadota bacterium]|nr:LytR C-terminal domain-containing protein [Gemmatimonadota bacterium]MDE2873610.1 LytR C-terminal domain-containing protein [Gemmatimonadota bacterium]
MRHGCVAGGMPGGSVPQVADVRRLVGSGLLLVVMAGVVLLLGSALGQWIPGDAAPHGRAVLSPGTERVTVEVRNAGGVAGMARAATDRLRHAGFDVVTVGNATNFDQEGSVVIDRIGEPETALVVAGALGIDSVKSEPDPGLYVDVTVRLGSGWAAPRENGPAGETLPPAWPRGVGPATKSDR